MKKTFILLALSFALIGGTAQAKEKDKCTKIKSDKLTISDDKQINTGYDKWGYNYETHLFKGTYCNAFQNSQWCQPWKNDQLSLRWNDQWLSNRDCDGDRELDRYREHSSYIGSGAWLRGHQSGISESENGEKCAWNYFMKIIAKPNKDFDCNDQGGEEIWGDFCKFSNIDNEKCAEKSKIGLDEKIPSLGVK